MHMMWTALWTDPGTTSPLSTTIHRSVVERALCSPRTATQAAPRCPELQAPRDSSPSGTSSPQAYTRCTGTASYRTDPDSTPPHRTQLIGGRLLRPIHL